MTFTPKCEAESPQDRENRYGQFIIVSNVIDMTTNIPQLCATAPQRTQDGIAKAIADFRMMVPELIQLVNRSPLLDEAKEKNKAFLEKAKQKLKTPQDIEEGCIQMWNFLAYNNQQGPSHFAKWTNELRKQAEISNPAVNTDAAR